MKEQVGLETGVGSLFNAKVLFPLLSLPHLDLRRMSCKSALDLIRDSGYDAWVEYS